MSLIKASFRVISSINGVPFGQTVNVEATNSVSGGFSNATALPAAKSGTLTTRTDNAAGVVTLNNHGYSNGDKIGVYWGTGTSFRNEVEVSSVATNTFNIAAGAGTNLPVVSTALTISKEKKLICDLSSISTSILTALGIYCSDRSVVVIKYQNGGAQKETHFIQKDQDLIFVDGMINDQVTFVETGILAANGTIDEILFYNLLTTKILTGGYEALFTVV